MSGSIAPPASAPPGPLAGTMAAAQQVMTDKRTYINLNATYRQQDEVSLTDDVRLLALQFGAV